MQILNVSILEYVYYIDSSICGGHKLELFVSVQRFYLFSEFIHYLITFSIVVLFNLIDSIITHGFSSFTCSKSVVIIFILIGHFITVFLLFVLGYYGLMG